MPRIKGEEVARPRFVPLTISRYKVPVWVFWLKDGWRAPRGLGYIEGAATPTELDVSEYFDDRPGLYTMAKYNANGSFAGVCKQFEYPQARLRKNPETRIDVYYSTVDGYFKEKNFQSLADAQAFAQKYVGTHPEIGSSYAISADGVGKIEVDGAALEDLFPEVRRTYTNPQAETLVERWPENAGGLGPCTIIQRADGSFTIRKQLGYDSTEQWASTLAEARKTAEDMLDEWYRARGRRRNPEIRKRNKADLDTYTIRLPLVKSGTMAQLNAWAKQQGLTWRRNKHMLFGGYWVDDATGTTYEIT